MTSSAPSPPAPPPPDDGARDAALARSGDRAAFARLYQRFAPVIHAVLLGQVPRAEADDLTQETFTQALRGLPNLRDPAAFPAWVLTIARNLAAARGRRLTHVPAPPGEGPAADPRREDVSPEAARALAAVRELPEAYRETLLMRLVEGLTGPQIAERTGLTEGSVRVNLTRGMAMLRERLGGTGGTR